MNLFKKLLGKEKKEIPSIENTILLDYVKLGVPKSEKAHEGLFCWSEPREHFTSTFGGAPYTKNTNNMPQKTHFRSYATDTGVKFVFEKPVENASLLLQIIVNDIPFEIGMMKYANKETDVYISADGEQWKSVGSYLLGYEDKLTTVQFPIENFSGKVLYVKLDNRKNLESSENHYGQEVHFIGVYKKQ
jgi:hypothetical protein